jgi:hypothetical protein
MDPTTRIIFVQKIIIYSVPIEIIYIPKQLENYFKVNNTWGETVINYLDHVWNQKGFNESTVWHLAVSGIKSEKFWETIAQKK